MTIISARSLSAADIRHLEPNLAAAVRRDRHDAHTVDADVQSPHNPFLPTLVLF